MVTTMGQRSRSRERQGNYGHRQFYGNSNYRGNSRSYSNYYKGRFGSKSPEEYQNLRLSYISDSVSNHELRQILDKEFGRIGVMHTKVLDVDYNTGQRIAYVNFDQCGDARVARKRLRDKMVELLGSDVRIDPAGIIKDQSGRYVSARPGYSPSRRGPRNRSLDNNEDGGSPPQMSPRGRSRGGVNRYYSEDGPRRDRSRSPMGMSPPRRRPASPGEYAGRRGRSRSPGHRSYGAPFSDEQGGRGFRNDRHFSPTNQRRGRGDSDEIETRTLFVGNLGRDISYEDLRDVFGKYGTVEDIDIKRNSDNPFAFVQFQNLDMARQAKIMESGRSLKGSRMNIGYGKAKQSRRLWIGGIEKGTISLLQLEKELDRFGAIEKIDYLRGENHAYVLFDSMEAAVIACQEIREFGIAGRKPRVDFASDDNPLNGETRGAERNVTSDTASTDRTRKQSENSSESSNKRKGEKSPDANSHDQDHSPSIKKARTSGRSEPLAVLTQSVTSVEKDLLCKEPLLPHVWSGAFVLKRSAYPVMLYHLKGSMSLVNRYVRNAEGGVRPLTVSQRLKLDQPKKDDIPKWKSSADYCFLLAIPWNAGAEGVKSLSLPADEGGAAMQPRSLKLLVKYFKDKDAAGVVYLASSKPALNEPQGMLYAFPACDFSSCLMDALSDKVDLLRTCSEEVLLLVLIRGSV